jgi:hypothetical protein
MAGTIPEAAELDTLNAMISSILPNWYMRLIASNFTPGTGTTLASLLAIEAAFTGYTPSALTTWSAASIDGTTAAITTNSQGVFTATSSGGTGNLWGYFLTDSTGSHFYGCEKFAGAPLSQAQGVAFEVDVTYSGITRF